MIKSLRREQILRNSLSLVREHGFPALTLRAAAAKCGCGLATVKRQFPNQPALCRAVATYARVVEDAAIMAEAARLFPVDTTSQL